eukprot:1949178-Amphidinium_carterae.1
MAIGFGQDYILMANSWGRSWGNGGLVKARYMDRCDGSCVQNPSIDSDNLDHARSRMPAIAVGRVPRILKFSPSLTCRIPAPKEHSVPRELAQVDALCALAATFPFTALPCNPISTGQLIFGTGTSSEQPDKSTMLSMLRGSPSSPQHHSGG